MNLKESLLTALVVATTLFLIMFFINILGENIFFMLLFFVGLLTIIGVSIKIIKNREGTIFVRFVRITILWIFVLFGVIVIYMNGGYIANLLIG